MHEGSSLINAETHPFYAAKAHDYGLVISHLGLVQTRLSNTIVSQINCLPV